MILESVHLFYTNNFKLKTIVKAKVAAYREGKEDADGAHLPMGNSWRTTLTISSTIKVNWYPWL